MHVSCTTPCTAHRAPHRAPPRAPHTAHHTVHHTMHHTVHHTVHHASQVATLVAVFGPVTGCGMNPARDLGPPGMPNGVMAAAELAPYGSRHLPPGALRPPYSRFQGRDSHSRFAPAVQLWGLSEALLKRRCRRLPLRPAPRHTLHRMGRRRALFLVGLHAGPARWRRLGSQGLPLPCIHKGRRCCRHPCR